MRSGAPAETGSPRTVANWIARWFFAPSPHSSEAKAHTRLRRLLATTVALLSATVAMWNIQVPTPWLDESVTLLVMQRSWSQLFLLFAGGDSPLTPYYFVAKVAVSMLPWLRPLVAIRIVSALAMTGAAVCLFALVARRAGLGPALLASAFLVSLPGWSRYAQEARPYGLLVLATTASWLAWDSWQRSENQRPIRAADWLAGGIWGPLRYAACLAASVVTHLFGFLLWPAQLLADLTTPHISWTHRWRRVVTSASAMLAALLLACVPVVLALTHGAGPQISNDRVGRVTILTKITEAFTTDGEDPWPVLILAILAVIAVLAYALRLRLARRYRDLLRILLLWLLVPIALAAAAGLLRPALSMSRYFVPALPAASALAAVGLVMLAEGGYRLLSRLRTSSPRTHQLRSVLALGAAAVLIAAPFLVHAQLNLSLEATIRKINGHSMSPNRALKQIDQMLKKDPGMPVAIHPCTWSTIIIAARPELKDRNPLCRVNQDSSNPFPIDTTATDVQAATAGHNSAVWLEGMTGKQTRTLAPVRLINAGFRLSNLHYAGDDWWIADLNR